MGPIRRGGVPLFNRVEEKMNDQMKQPAPKVLPHASWDARKKAKELMNDGIWIRDFPVQGLGKIDLKFRSRDGVKYQEKLTAIYKPIRARYGKGDVPPEIAGQVLTQVLAEAVLVDWARVPNEKGEDMPYNATNANEFLDMYPDVRDALSALTADYSAFLAQAEADTKGN